MVLPYSESYFEETKYILVKFYQFYGIQKYYFKRTAFKKEYESSIIFQALSANIPAEPPSYAPTFFMFTFAVFLVTKILSTSRASHDLFIF